MIKIDQKLVSIASLFVLVLVWSQVRVGVAGREAVVHAERAEQAQRLREASEEMFSALADQYDAQGDSLGDLHDAVEEATEEARALRVESRITSGILMGQVEEVAGDYEATVAWADSLSAAHKDEVYALEVSLSAIKTENAVLWKRVEFADSVLAISIEVNATLREEVAEWRNAYESTSESIWSKMRDDAELMGTAVLIGAAGWEVIRGG
jgi:hypothetical protein|tara:strand:- start:3175 stop:3804 length:630 start_codon:yes stop_codon:yes gene_type:complete